MRAHAQKRAHALGTDLGNRILLMILLSWSSLSHSSSSGRRPHARAHTGTRSDARVARVSAMQSPGKPGATCQLAEAGTWGGQRSELSIIMC